MNLGIIDADLLDNRCMKEFENLYPLIAKEYFDLKFEDIREYR